MQAVRAEERTPVTKTDIGRDAVDLVNRGQEMPFLLGATPAVNFQSDTGLAAGYAYFNIRGIGPTRQRHPLTRTTLTRPARPQATTSRREDMQQWPGSYQGTPIQRA